MHRRDGLFLTYCLNCPVRSLLVDLAFHRLLLHSSTFFVFIGTRKMSLEGMRSWTQCFTSLDQFFLSPIPGQELWSLETSKDQDASVSLYIQSFPTKLGSFIENHHSFCVLKGSVLLGNLLSGDCPSHNTSLSTMYCF